MTIDDPKLTWIRKAASTVVVASITVEAEAKRELDARNWTRASPGINGVRTSAVTKVYGYMPSPVQQLNVVSTTCDGQSERRDY